MDKRLNPVRLHALTAFAAVAAAAAGADTGVRAFSGVAYGGGVIMDHPYLDNVVFDISTTKLDTPAPALYGHGDPVGVIKAAVLGDRIEISGDLFSDMDGHAKNIASMSDRGMPWQMSVGIWPGRIESVKAGVDVTVNGQQFTGPLTVFRDNRVREVSFCALGADSETDAQIFSLGNDRQNFSKDDYMNQTEHEAAVAVAVAAALAPLNAAAVEKDTRIAALEAQFAATAKAARMSACKALMGEKFTETLAAPYLGMNDEQFAAVSQLFSTTKTAVLGALGKEVATGDAAAAGAGDGGVQMSVGELVSKATAFKAERAAAGFTVSDAEAVAYVKQKAAA